MPLSQETAPTTISHGITNGRLELWRLTGVLRVSPLVYCELNLGYSTYSTKYNQYIIQGKMAERSKASG